MPPTAQLSVLTDAERLAVALPPLRRQLLHLLAQPESATGLARRLDLPRQKINYHLRELERAGLVELVEERRRRGMIERRLRATARAWVIDPALLAGGSVEPTEFRDRFASAYLVAAAARAIRDVATLRERASVTKQRLATFTLESEITFASPRDLRAFTNELEAHLIRLSQQYHRPGGRRFHLLVAGHPRVAPTQPRQTEEPPP
ncbi:MAG: helix-turn-helix transcriptional regulator [Chloroflexi bacterium]|nr:helix-turn-helix transcriptional regulator [Chloroflexota bacterium]